MPPAVVARAFEPFFTTKEVGKGTGLGLSQVYGFIAQSGGDVVIDSEEGKGTTISMYLPVVEGTSDESVIATGASVDTVLIVEDEPDVLDAAGQLFRSIGYEVVTATNAIDAMVILEGRTDIDILFDRRGHAEGHERYSGWHAPRASFVRNSRSCWLRGIHCRRYATSMVGSMISPSLISRIGWLN